jgi:transposase
MPKLLQARPPVDEAEEQQIRRLAGARSATFDTVLRSRMVVLSWEGYDTAAIAAEVRCHPKTVREWINRFNQDGVSSLTERPKVGRKPRLTEDDRRNLIALAHMSPEQVREEPAGAQTRRDSASAERQRPAPWSRADGRWTLDGLVDAARARGIHISRSQLRRILYETGFHWDRDGHWIPPVASGSKRAAVS